MGSIAAQTTSYGKPSRSPCPALNVLANEGYIPRQGEDIHFWDLLAALKVVYNLSFPLALLLTLAGFLTCGKLSFASSGTKRSAIQSRRGGGWSLLPSWTLDLSSLAQRGPTKIAHRSSLVHASDKPSQAPDPVLLRDVIDYGARSAHHGLGLAELGSLHHKRLGARALDSFHEQVALGECGLAWLVMRERSQRRRSTTTTASSSNNSNSGGGGGSSAPDGAIGRSDGHDEVIPLHSIRTWLGEELLPTGWWTSGRPSDPIGLFEARKHAGIVKRFAGLG